MQKRCFFFVVVLFTFEDHRMALLQAVMTGCRRGGHCVLGWAESVEMIMLIFLNLFFIFWEIRSNTHGSDDPRRSLT